MMEGAQKVYLKKMYILESNKIKLYKKTKQKQLTIANQLYNLTK